MAEITDVRIFKTKAEGPQKAFVSVTLDGEFAVHGVRVMKREDGTLWVAFPSRKDANGGYRDVFHPVTKDARERISKAVLDAYESQED